MVNMQFVEIFLLKKQQEEFKTVILTLLDLNHLVIMKIKLKSMMKLEET